METKRLPLQLRKEDLGFVKLMRRSKKPFEHGWQAKPNSLHQIEDWFAEGNNYGVLGGMGGLIILDADDPIMSQILQEKLPKTFTVKTPRRGIHGYFYCKEIMKKIVLKKDDTHYGEIISFGAQVVGPGSIHPDTGTEYEVMIDVEIAEITAEQVYSVLIEYIQIDLSSVLPGSGTTNPKDVSITREESIQFSNETKEICLEDLKVDSAVRELIRKGKEDGDKYSSRSEADYRVICALVKADCSDDTIKSIFENFPIGQKYHEQGEAYLKHTINKARQTTEEQRSLVPVRDIRELLSDQQLHFNPHKIVHRLLEERRLIYCASTFYVYGDGFYQDIDGQVVKKWIVDMVGLDLSKKMSEEVIYFLQIEVFLDVKNLNNTNLLNLKNGLLNLDTWDLIPHTPDIYSTILIFPRKSGHNEEKVLV